MMIVDWINKNIEEVNFTELFNLYFKEYETLKDEDVYYMINKEKGIDIMLSNDNIITSIHFYSGEHGDSKAYTDKLPNGISFCLSRENIHSLFGVPDKTGGGEFNVFFGRVKKWDKYFYADYSVHLEYSDSEDKILLITCASKKLEPYFNINMQ